MSTPTRSDSSREADARKVANNLIRTIDNIIRSASDKTWSLKSVEAVSNRSGDLTLHFSIELVDEDSVEVPTCTGSMVDFLQQDDWSKVSTDEGTPEFARLEKMFCGLTGSTEDVRWEETAIIGPVRIRRERVDPEEWVNAHEPQSRVILTRLPKDGANSTAGSSNLGWGGASSEGDR